MDTIVNTKHDTSGYDCFGYQHEIRPAKGQINDANILYQAFLKSRQGSHWKSQVQKFEMNLLTELSAIQKDIENKEIKLKPPNEFIQNERGKIRLISGEHIYNRVIKGALTDHELLPAITPKLIHYNGASLKGKGTGFQRAGLEKHLRHYYHKHQTNEGYILLMDFSKYFDNIRHDLFRGIFEKHQLSGDLAYNVLDEILKASRIDVSYMDPEEYSVCLGAIFNSLEYNQIPKSQLTGQKYMEKHFQIGCPVAQVAGIAAPMEIDNYIKIVKGMKYYGRYMDDSYIIHREKEVLEELLTELVEVAKNLGIFIHPNKTRIVKLSSYWRFMQIQYSLTDTGRVIKKINPKRLTAFRRKLKKLVLIMTEEEFDNYYKSWFRAHYKIMSKKQRENLDNLHKELKIKHYGKEQQCKLN